MWLVFCTQNPAKVSYHHHLTFRTFRRNRIDNKRGDSRPSYGAALDHVKEAQIPSQPASDRKQIGRVLGTKHQPPRRLGKHRLLTAWRLQSR